MHDHLLQYAEEDWGEQISLLDAYWSSKEFPDLTIHRDTAQNVSMVELLHTYIVSLTVYSLHTSTRDRNKIFPVLLLPTWSHLRCMFVFLPQVSPTCFCHISLLSFTGRHQGSRVYFDICLFLKHI